ncbi:MAG: hypothetical protein IJW00_02375 [Clostridia bacterium]|nr:hypothetical protein [Clostridia bacterium]
MAFSKRNPGDRYARRALRRGALKDPRKTRQTVLIISGALVVVILALIWGNHLKAESDARRAAEEAGEWLLDENAATPIPVAVPAINAGYAPPSGKMANSDKLKLQAVTFDLGSCTSALPYSVSLPEGSGMSIADGAPELASEVRRFKNAGLRVICVFTVTSLSATDMTERTLRQGQEMTLFSLFAKAGVDEILLLGLPVGNDSLDTAATKYLMEIETLLASVPTTVPAVGVALYPAAFAGEVSEDGTILYAGSLTPGRMLAVCDYVTLDLRGLGTQVDTVLQGMQYAYVRYNLRLLTAQTQPELTDAAVSHGFSRILEFGK